MQLCTNFSLLNLPVTSAEILLHCCFDSGVIVLDEERELLELICPVVERIGPT